MVWVDDLNGLVLVEETVAGLCEAKIGVADCFAAKLVEDGVAVCAGAVKGTSLVVVAVSGVRLSKVSCFAEAVTTRPGMAIGRDA